ncbi:MAG: hypothetical protein AABZ23_04665 [Deltaproteobacteria bacterium]
MKRLSLFVLTPFLFLAFVLAAHAQSIERPPELTRDARQAFISGAIVVKGEGAAPSDKALSTAQKRIMALRAAKVIALREVAEILDGVTVSGETTVVNAAAESDTVRVAVQGIVKGAQVVKEVYEPLSEMGTVYLSVPLSGPDGVMAQLLPQVMQSVPLPQMPAYAPPPIAADSMDGYDGLIIEVIDRGFRPALINRVLAKNGEVVYDPTKVAQDILVERGAAEYTNNLGKAKALLSERGSKNPVVATVQAIVKSTDVEISPADATKIFISNQRRNFLEGAKVVFVLQQ